MAKTEYVNERKFKSFGIFECMEPVVTEFNPGISHPFYFIRNGLIKAIKKQSHHLSGRMMDFGCGSKPYRNLFNVSEYVGVDFHNEGHPHDNEHIDVIYNGNQLPFPDSHFDSVLSSEVFEHIFNLPDILQELHRVMKPAGKLLITCPFVWNEHEVPHDYARYTKFALYDMMEKNGFRVLEFDKSGNFITTTFQIWILYWYTILNKAAKKNLPARWFLKYFLVFPLNISGLVTNFIFPDNKSLYLNNVLLAEKKHSG